MTNAGSSSIGRLGDSSAVRTLVLDDVVATYVVDGVLLIDAGVGTTANEFRDR